jgi:Plasmid pRiA4b ORF-3-like protein
MEAQQTAGAVQLSARLRGVSPPVRRRLRVAEQISLAELHAALQVAFGWSDEHLYTFKIRGWRFGDPGRAIELALAGGGVDIPLAAFGFEIGEPFLYQYNLFIPWEIDCRIEARGLILAAQPVTCKAASGDPPDEDVAGPAAYPQWRMDSDPTWVLHQVEELLEEDLDDERFRAEACEILTQARTRSPTRRAIAERLQQLPGNAWDARSLYEDAGPAGH